MCPCVIKFNSVKEFTLGFRSVDVAAKAIKYCEESFDGSISYCSDELRNTWISSRIMAMVIDGNPLSIMSSSSSLSIVTPTITSL